MHNCCGPSFMSDINECSGVVCQHGGTCLDLENQFSCHCALGYSGLYCQQGIHHAILHSHAPTFEFNPFTTVDVYIRHDVCSCPTDDVYIRPRCTSRLYWCLNISGAWNCSSVGWRIWSTCTQRMWPVCTAEQPRASSLKCVFWHIVQINCFAQSSFSSSCPAVSRQGK